MIGNINLTPILQALLGLLAAVITYRLVPWIKENTSEKQRTNLCAAANIAVFAAEQLFGANKELNTAKLNYALERLKEAGFDMDTTVLRCAIESQVKEMKDMLIVTEDGQMPENEPKLQTEQIMEQELDSTAAE